MYTYVCIDVHIRRICVYIYIQCIYIVLYIQDIYTAQGFAISIAFFLHSLSKCHLSGALVEKLPNFRFLAWQSVGGFSSSPSLNKSLEGLKFQWGGISDGRCKQPEN